jgi:hypothetical protein
MIGSSLAQNLRPLILKETRIDVLSDLCTTLLSHLVNSSSSQTPNERKPISKGISINAVVESILNDTQSRLSFRAQEYIQSEIRNFRPKEKEMMVLARGPDCKETGHINYSSTSAS